MENQNNTPWWKPGLVIFTKVSASVAIPIVLALFIGKYFDKKYNSEPWIFLGLPAIAFAISIFSIWKNVKNYIDDLEKKEKELRASKME